MMKISHEDAITLISKIIHSTINDIKKLTQRDRKICMKAIECFSSKEDKEINIESSNKLSFDMIINSVQLSLDSKSKPKKMRLIALIISAVKGILNLFHLRINSVNLYKNLELIKKTFLTDNWDQYLQEYCDVYCHETASCNLNTAKIIFIGDQHADYIQNIVRQNLITHYAVEDQKGKNLVLLEGLDTSCFPKSSDDKNFTVESWESKEHFEEHGKAIEENCKLLKEMNIKLKELEQLKGNKNFSLKEKKQNVIELLTKIKNITAQMEVTKVEKAKLKKIRDEDLIAKVKINALKQEGKIFVIAGSNHLLENEYKILDIFNDFPCAVIIPKVSNLGEQNADKVVQNIIKLGTYNAAYVDL